jgi:hypothetical protein
VLDANESKCILNNQYNKSFFYCFVKILNLSWLAAQLVSNTDIIKNNKKGLESYLAQFIKYSSEDIPIISSGLKLIKVALKAIDEEKQREIFRSLSDFDHQEMNKFSRKLATAILTHGVDKDALSKPEQLIKRCEKWIKQTKNSLIHILQSAPDDM